MDATSIFDIITLSVNSLLGLIISDNQSEKSREKLLGWGVTFTLLHHIHILRYDHPFSLCIIKLFQSGLYLCLMFLTARVYQLQYTVMKHPATMQKIIPNMHMRFSQMGLINPIFLWVTTFMIPPEIIHIFENIKVLVIFTPKN